MRPKKEPTRYVAIINVNSSIRVRASIRNDQSRVGHAGCPGRARTTILVPIDVGLIAINHPSPLFPAGIHDVLPIARFNEC